MIAYSEIPNEDKFYLLFEQEIQIRAKLVVYSWNAMYQHKIKIYSIQSFEIVKMCNVIPIKVTLVCVMCFLSLQWTQWKIYRTRTMCSVFRQAIAKRYHFSLTEVTLIRKI